MFKRQIDKDNLKGGYFLTLLSGEEYLNIIM